MALPCPRALSVPSLRSEPRKLPSLPRRRDVVIAEKPSLEKETSKANISRRRQEIREELSAPPRRSVDLPRRRQTIDLDDDEEKQFRRASQASRRSFAEEDYLRRTGHDLGEGSGHGGRGQGSSSAGKSTNILEVPVDISRDGDPRERSKNHHPCIEITFPRRDAMACMAASLVASFLLTEPAEAGRIKPGTRRKIREKLDKMKEKGGVPNKPDSGAQDKEIPPAVLNNLAGPLAAHLEPPIEEVGQAEAQQHQAHHPFPFPIPFPLHLLHPVTPPPLLFPRTALHFLLD
ncbi:hypothetical protein Taro_003126 [Colocasia esculenta]|uniref:Uncharacterized protein n=1 Tax=Colocasia esculenta TaxID=4460 RepID=A0A843TIG6_COLES|nr:hypothetical protein [Colocasia esculenta]